MERRRLAGWLGGVPPPVFAGVNACILLTCVSMSDTQHGAPTTDQRSREERPRTGEELVALFQDAPLDGVSFEHEPVRAPVRDVEL